MRVDGGVSSAGGAGCGWVLWGRVGGGSRNGVATVGHRVMATAGACDGGLISGLRFLTAAVQSGVIETRRPPGGIDIDQLKARARPQLWAGLMRCRDLPTPWVPAAPA